VLTRLVVDVAGLSTCDVITQCLSEGAASTVVRVALTISLIVTYPLVLYPATEIVERALLVEVGTISLVRAGPAL
jgi:hypothetical protein